MNRNTCTLLFALKLSGLSAAVPCTGRLYFVLLHIYISLGVAFTPNHKVLYSFGRGSRRENAPISTLIWQHTPTRYPGKGQELSTHSLTLFRLINV